jgi:hypothetical protein
MKSTLQITHGEGIAPSTDRMSLHEAAQLVTTQSHLTEEARALIEFDNANIIPPYLRHGAWVHMCSGPSDNFDGSTVETYRAVENLPRVIIDGRSVDFGTVVNLMDDDIRERLHSSIVWDELYPGTCQNFANAYCVAHAEKFGEDFKVN